jgi:cell division septation protein DedD
MLNAQTFNLITFNLGYAPLRRECRDATSRFANANANMPVGLYNLIPLNLFRMKLQRTTLVLLITATLLGSAVYFSETQRAQNLEATKTTKEPIFSFKEDQIESVTIYVDKETLEFERISGQISKWRTNWRMKQPKEAPASDAAVAFLLGLLEQGKSDRSFFVPTNQRQEYGFDKPSATVKVQLNNKKTHRLVLGKPDFSRTFIYALADSPPETPDQLKVLLVPIDFEYAVNRPLSEWQSKVEQPDTLTPSPTAENPKPSPTSQEAKPSPTSKSPQPSPTTDKATPSPTANSPKPSPSPQTPKPSSTSKSPQPSPTTNKAIPSPTANSPKPSPSPQTPKPSATANSPKPSLSPQTPKPSATANSPKPSPSPQTPKPSATANSPKPSPSPQTPKPSPTSKSPKPSPSPQTAKPSAASPSPKPSPSPQTPKPSPTEKKE